MHPLPPLGEGEESTSASLAKAEALATLDADLGCSSSYSIKYLAKAWNLLEDRSVEKGFLPTAVAWELAGP